MRSQLLTVTPPDPELTRIATLAALGWLGYRLILIALFPLVVCRRCEGRGGFVYGENWRNCGRCEGSGRHLRLGRRVWRWATRDRERV